MPKAAVNENSLPQSREDEVWTTRQVAPMQTESAPNLVDNAPNCKLWPRIGPANPGHVETSLLASQNIH